MGNFVSYPASGTADPLVPDDGVQNVTGGLAVSGTLSADTVTTDGAQGITIGNGVINNDSNGNHKIIINHGTDIPITLQSAGADGAAVVMARIAAYNDLTTAGAKILSIGDNAGTSYAEKAYFDLYGHASFGTGNVATVTSDAGSLSAGFKVGTAAQFVRNASGGATINSVENIELQAGSGEKAIKFTRGGFAPGGLTAVKTAAYTATLADFLVLADPAAAAGSFAVTLPAANAATGQLLTVKVTAIDAAKVITVIRAGADTIEGVTAGQTTTTFTTTSTLASATFQSDGTSKWYLIASNGTVT